MAIQSPAPQAEPQMVPTDQLHLDPRNPRIQQIDHDLFEDGILDILWREYSVDEVALSIAQNGYFHHEPLFADDEDVVIEGNRRLAAVRILRDPEIRKRLQITNLPAVSPDRIDDLARLPVIRCEREQIWRYIGFKHVNGPQAWNSFAKAEYIAWVKNELHQDLSEIALTIGDRHSTVQRLYRAFMALRQASESGVYEPGRRMRRHFSFSHLYTGLDYLGIREFTGVADLEPPQEKPIPADKINEFGELCVWLWGDKSRGIEPMVRSQNPHLRQLDEALRSEHGLSALRADYDIARVYDIARGDTTVFRASLLKAKQSLQEARGKVLTGFNGEEDWSNEMSTIVELAESLEDDMKRIAEAQRRRARPKRRALHRDEYDDEP